MTSSFGHRLSSGIRVSWASSTTFATYGTAFVALIVLPLLDVLFSVLMGADLAAPDIVRTGYAAALVALGVSVAAGIVSAVAADRNRGVFLEVHTRRRVDAAYWLARATVPMLFALATGGAAIVSVYWMSGNRDAHLLLKVLGLSVITIICGVLLGIAASGIGVDLPDPYLGATLVAAFLPVLAGVIVPQEFFPGWLRVISLVVPLSGTLSAIDAAPGDVVALVARDLAMASALAAIGILLTRHAVVRLRRGLRREVL